MDDNTATANLTELVADIVGAYVSNNPVPTTDLPGLISQVHAALQRAASGTAEPKQETPEPAVSVRKSVTPDHIVCLEDGKKFKCLKRHLRTDDNLSPAEYRAKWGLPRDYPMVAPNYAQARSDLAKQMGLGRKAAEPAPAPAPKGRAARGRRGAVEA